MAGQAAPDGARDAAGPVALVAVGEQVLDRLVEAALSDAAAAEVTPPVTPGDAWTPERVAWLRAFHRDRRAGLTGPHQEATWAVTEAGAVVGSVRLRRTAEPGTAETGLWLTRAARGRGVGRQVLAELVDRVRELGCTELRAETTAGNAPAQAVLRALGFTPDRSDGDVRARLALTG